MSTPVTKPSPLTRLASASVNVTAMTAILAGLLAVQGALQGLGAADLGISHAAFAGITVAITGIIAALRVEVGPQEYAAIQSQLGQLQQDYAALEAAHTALQQQQSTPALPPKIAHIAITFEDGSGTDIPLGTTPSP